MEGALRGPFVVSLQLHVLIAERSDRANAVNLFALAKRLELLSEVAVRADNVKRLICPWQRALSSSLKVAV